MASLAFSNFSGRAPRRRAGEVSGFRGPAAELAAGPTAISWLSTAGWLLLVVGVSPEACPAGHKKFVTSATQSSIHSRSQYPDLLKASRGTIHGFTGRDCSQSRSPGLISGGLWKPLPSSTVFEARKPVVVCLPNLPRILTA